VRTAARLGKPAERHLQITLDAVLQKSKLPRNKYAYVTGVKRMSLFRHYHDSFNPETLAILQSVLDETWTALQNKGSTFDELETRTAIADPRWQGSAPLPRADVCLVSNLQTKLQTNCAARRSTSQNKMGWSQRKC
jgi:hypothetical protein